MRCLLIMRGYLRWHLQPRWSAAVTASLDQTIKIWRVRDGSLQHTLSGYQQAVTDVEFVADGSGLLSVGGNLKLWDIRTGALLKTVEGTTIAAAESIDMSDDRQWIVSSSVNGGMRLQAWKFDRLIQDGCEQISAYLSTNPTVRDKENLRRELEKENCADWHSTRRIKPGS